MYVRSRGDWEPGGREKGEGGRGAGGGGGAESKRSEVVETGSALRAETKNNYRCVFFPGYPKLILYD